MQLEELNLIKISFLFSRNFTVGKRRITFYDLKEESRFFEDRSMNRPCSLNPALISTLRACLPDLLGGPRPDRPFISWHTFVEKARVGQRVIQMQTHSWTLTYWKRHDSTSKVFPMLQFCISATKKFEGLKRFLKFKN